MEYIIIFLIILNFILYFTLKSPKKCPVHKIELLAGEAQAMYGRIPPKDPENEKTKFPYSNTMSFMGCRGPRQDKIKVKYCPQCREEESNLEKNNKAPMKMEYK